MRWRDEEIPETASPRRSDCHIVVLGKPQFAALRGSLFGALKIIEQNCGVLCVLDDGYAPRRDCLPLSPERLKGSVFVFERKA